MIFRYYKNAISQASRAVAASIFVVGLLLIGFGVVIVALPEVFAYIAAFFFFVMGVGCAIIALKIFLAQRALDKLDNGSPFNKQAHRKNVRIHTEEYDDL